VRVRESRRAGVRSVSVDSLVPVAVGVHAARVGERTVRVVVHVRATGARVHLEHVARVMRHLGQCGINGDLRHRVDRVGDCWRKD
jgi:hypothetical protein